MHTEQVGQFVQPGQRHTTFEPVVDVLRCDAALGGKIGRGQATFVEQGFEAVAGSVHGSECSGGGVSKDMNRVLTGVVRKEVVCRELM